MSEIEESLEEPEANMYNAKKPWHKPDGPPVQSSDSLFYENQATHKRPLMKRSKKLQSVKELIIKKDMMT